MQSYPGYTTNISTTGMFLATNSPQPPGTRLRVEVIDGLHGFMVEGVVAHARKVRGDMMRINHPGMGIRFLSVEELVRELIPMLPGETEPIPETDRDWGQEHASTAQRAATPPPIPRPEPPPPAAPSTVPPPVHTTAPVQRPFDSAGTGVGVFNVQFLGASEFVEVFQRDILNGGLFVSTRYPGRLQETIKVELLPPVSGAEPVSFRARVVQRIEPHGNEFGPNLLAGMGVEILDLPTVLTRLRPYYERLRLL
jgi:hypothetical protein